MMRMLTAASAALFVVLTGPAARAQKQEFGEKGEFILGADRLVPLVSYSEVAQGNLGNLPPGSSGITTRVSQTSFSFFWGSTSPEETFFTAPRIGFDYVLLPKFTIGGEVILFVTAGASASVERDANNGTSTTTATPATNSDLFGIAPRAGYILKLTDVYAFWFRGGFSFYTLGNKLTIGNNTATGTDQFALDLDPQFVITPMAHLSFTVGPTLDLPLFGQHWADPNESASSQIFFFGVTAGMLGFF